MIENRIVSGKSAEIRAYGFSGKSPYHFSSKYFSPCATKIDSGKIMKIIISLLKPAMINPNMINSVAMEFLEAKKPLVVENSPISASDNIGRLSSGAKNTLWTNPCQVNNNVNPCTTLPKNIDGSKPSASKSSEITSGWFTILNTNTAIPPRISSAIKTSGTLGKLFTINLRCGCRKTNNTQNIAKYGIYGV